VNIDGKQRNGPVVYCLPHDSNLHVHVRSPTVSEGRALKCPAYARASDTICVICGVMIIKAEVHAALETNQPVSPRIDSNCPWSAASAQSQYRHEAGKHRATNTQFRRPLRCSRVRCGLD
jgi:hypothetical protein